MPRWVRRTLSIALPVFVSVLVINVVTAFAVNQDKPQHNTVGCPTSWELVVKPDGKWECRYPVRITQTSPTAGETSPPPEVQPSATPSTVASTTTSAPPPTTPAPTTTSPKPTPTVTPPSPTPTQTSGYRVITIYLTGYSYYDNTPPGSAEISNPIIHDVAAGKGTYDDPVTIAVGHSIVGGDDILDWEENTRFWIPSIHRYAIVEDTCGDGSRPQNGPCHTGYPSGASTWLDVYVDGKGAGSGASDDCMEDITKVVKGVIVNPGPEFNSQVVSGPISSSAGCRV